MSSKFEWMIAFRYLRARRRDGFISVIAGFSLVGISLGVMALIVVMSVMNGFREDLLDKILGSYGHASLIGYNGRLSGYEEIAENAGQVPGVVSAVPYLDGQVLVSNSKRNLHTGALIRGMSESSLETHDLIVDSLVTGSLDGFRDGYGLLIGDRLALRLGVKAGDSLTFTSPDGATTPIGRIPRIANYQIAGTFEVGVFDFDNQFVVMPLAEAQIFFKQRDSVTGVEVVLETPESVGDYLAEFEAILGERGVVRDWRQNNRQLVSALEVERTVMFIILTLIILVAAFNIVSSLIILVKDKSRDIAVMRTMGATRASVMRIFMITGTTIGVVGTLLGFIAGITLASNIDTIRLWVERTFDVSLWDPVIRFLSEVPSSINSFEVGATVAISITLSVLATVPPAWRASRLDPVEVLRYE